MKSTGLVLIAILLLSAVCAAQQAHKEIFIRIYNREYQRIAKGFLVRSPDSAVVIQHRSGNSTSNTTQSVADTIPVKYIYYIRTNRDIANTPVLGDVVNALSKKLKDSVATRGFKGSDNNNELYARGVFYSAKIVVSGLLRNGLFSNYAGNDKAAFVIDCKEENWKVLKAGLEKL